jgi:hypothetical protein
MSMREETNSGNATSHRPPLDRNKYFIAGEDFVYIRADWFAHQAPGKVEVNQRLQKRYAWHR